MPIFPNKMSLSSWKRQESTEKAMGHMIELSARPQEAAWVGKEYFNQYHKAICLVNPEELWRVNALYNNRETDSCKNLLLEPLKKGVISQKSNSDGSFYSWWLRKFICVL